MNGNFNIPCTIVNGPFFKYKNKFQRLNWIFLFFYGFCTLISHDSNQNLLDDISKITLGYYFPKGEIYSNVNGNDKSNRLVT